MRLRLFAAAAAVLSAGLAAHASPTFTFTFDPSTYYVGPTGNISFTATIDNTGSTYITGLSGYQAFLGTISPYATSGVYGTTGSASLDAEFAGIDLAPGDSFNFIYVTEGFANAPGGVYTAFSSAAISLEDSNGGTPDQAATNDPNIDVVTPEPSSFVLLGTGLAAAAGVLRRRQA